MSRFGGGEEGGMGEGRPKAPTGSGGGVGFGLEVVVELCNGLDRGIVALGLLPTYYSLQQWGTVL